MKRALLVAAGFLLPAFVDPAPPPYFAAAASRDTQQASFREDWFGGPLRAMDEPVFSRTAGNAGSARRLRLLVRPDRGPIYSIRIDEEAGGRARLAIVLLEGRNYVRNGRVTRRQVSVLPPARLAAIHAAAARGALPAQHASGTERPSRVLTDGSQEIQLCAHATYFIFETADESGTHFLQRDPCTMTREQAALADALVRLRSDAPAADRAILAEAMRGD